MKPAAALLVLSVLFCGYSCSQDEKINNRKENVRIGGPCEGCEAIYESPADLNSLGSTDTLPDFTDAGPKLVLGGTVYMNDGITPAPGVIIYIYHTDQEGIYPMKGDETGWDKRHGYLRGWIKTNDKGGYMFYTLKPAAYPSGNAPAHVHAVIKEPGINEYYIDDYVFEGDKSVNEYYKKMTGNKGGSGIITPEERDGILFGKRDIILGKNIKDY
jgi:protocatechuate 3,4-dioxygenase beta subunit